MTARQRREQEIQALELSKADNLRRQSDARINSYMRRLNNLQQSELSTQDTRG